MCACAVYWGLGVSWETGGWVIYRREAGGNRWPRTLVLLDTGGSQSHSVSLLVSLDTGGRGAWLSLLVYAF